MRLRVLVALLAALLLLGSAAAGPSDVAAAEPASPPAITAVDAGLQHGCAVLDGGDVACWGWNWAGGLGTGTRWDSVIPQPVALPRPAAAVTAGNAHACALLDDGTLRCWGSDFVGQVGNGSLADAVTLPVPVAGLDDVVAVSAGGMHTCAVRDDGTAWCWGAAGDGQLGLPVIALATTPRRVAGIDDATGVAAGDTHTCLLRTGGTVTCFGAWRPSNEITPEQAVPVDIEGITDAVELAAGTWFTCARLAEGSLRCFGANATGQLGNDDIANSDIPVTVAGIDDAVAIAAGPSHACAALADGTARCWGSGRSGALGTGVMDAPSARVPVAVVGVTAATGIAAGGEWGCARLEDGTGACWGRNTEGQLADRTVVSRATPAPISRVPDTTTPVPSAPTVTLRSGAVLHGRRLPATIVLAADDGPDGTGIDQWEVRWSRDGGRTWTRQESQPGTFHKRLGSSGSWIFRVRPIDRAGNPGAWVTGRDERVRLVQESADAIRWRGAWATGSKAAYSGGSTRYTVAADASATYTFTGRGVSIVSRQAPTRGSFRVLVDGVEAGIVDLGTTAERYRVVVFARTWPTVGEHTIRMVALGTAGHPRVDLDAFVVLR